MAKREDKITEATEAVEAIEPVITEQQMQIPGELPVLPLRDIVIYPFMIVPLFVSRERSIRAVDKALGEQRMILLDCQKAGSTAAFGEYLSNAMSGSFWCDH